MAWGYATQAWKVTKARMSQASKPKEGMTLIVAASDSNDTTRADYICTGSTDDVTINQALNALPSVGGTVILLEGTYNINASITIPNDDISLIGNGRATKIVTTQDISMITASNVKGVEISDLYLDGRTGEEDVASNNYGVYFHTVTNSEINNVQVFEVAGNVFYLNTCSRCRVVWCQTLADEGGSIVGPVVNFINTSESEILFCHTDESGSNGISLSSSSSNNLIMGNYIKGIRDSGNGIGISESDENRVIANKIETTEDGVDGIILYKSDRCIISENIIEDCNNGINITDAASNNNNVINNVIINAGGVAIIDTGTNTLPNGAVGTTNLQLDDLNTIA